MIFRRSRFIGFVAAGCVCFLLSSCAKTKRIDLNILYIENPKFQGLSDEDISMITTFIKKDMRNFFNINVQNTTVDKVHIEDYAKNENKSLGALASYKVTQIANVHYEKLKFIKDNVEWGGMFKNKSIMGIAQEIINKNTEVLKMLGLEDGKPDKNNEYSKYSIRSWLERLERINKYDLIIYNGVLIDDCAAVVHTLVRGLIAFGVAERNNSKYKGTGMVATLPVMSEDLPFSKWKGEGLSIFEKRKVISIIACHELGHLLFDYDDIYNHDNCVMNPEKGYDFQSSLSTKKCNKSHPKLGYFTEAVFKGDMCLFQ